MPSAGWTWVGERISAVAPAGYEADASVTEAIHSFDPGVIPIWRISAYVPPGRTSPQTFVHHGIGRHFPYQRRVRRHFQCDMPLNATFGVPNFLDCIFEDTNSAAYIRGGPGDFWPWDWGVYYWARWHFERITAAAWVKRMEKRRAREAKARKDWEDDLEYRKRQLEPWIQKQLEKLSDADWDRYRAFMRERDRAIREGRTPPSHRMSPKKVHFDLGQTAGRSPRFPFQTYARVAPSVVE